MAVIGTGAVSKLNFGWIDHSAERTNTGFYIPAIEDDGSNLSMFTATTGKIDLLKIALGAVSKLNFTKTNVTIEADSDAPSLPAEPTAQRERALVVKYLDDVTHEYGSFSIPSPIDAFELSVEDIPLDHTEFAAFIAVLEAQALSRDGNSITVVSGRMVSRAT